MGRSHHFAGLVIQNPAPAFGFDGAMAEACRADDPTSELRTTSRALRLTGRRFSPGSRIYRRGENHPVPADCTF
jgi:hypothetical protein